MAKADKQFFWTKTGETFAGKNFGEEVTDFFSGDLNTNGTVKKESRLSKLIALGKVSKEKPETFKAAENGELVGLRKTVESQKTEIETLKNEIATAPKTVKDANIKIADLEGKIFDLEKDSPTDDEKDKKIKDLEKQVEDLTDPDDGASGDGK